MTTETILTKDARARIKSDLSITQGEGLLNLIIDEVEQAVLQSPEIQALRKDAARYRWLRDGGNDDIGVVMGFDCIDAGPTAVVGTYGEGLDGEHLDDAIDAAMEQQK